MMCQNCGKNPATTHVKRNINGKTAEWHLCADCAAKQGLGQGLVPMLGGLGFELGDFWGSLFAEPAAREQKNAERCPGCGSSFNEIAQSGKVGCARCYTAFYDRLLPSVQRIHGKTKHAGKVPAYIAEEEKRAEVQPPAEPERKEAAGAAAAEEPADTERTLTGLREELTACIERQEYEKCAAIRDRIRELEQSRGQQKDKEEEGNSRVGE